MASLKVLVVAAAGGLGSSVVREALARGHVVSVLVRDAAKLAGAGVPVASLAAVHTGDASSPAVVAAALAGGVDAIVSAAPPVPAAARALGEAAAASASVRKVVWTAGSSNLYEPDGKTLHHVAFGPRGLGFYSAHAPCLDALVAAAGPKAMAFCPGMMSARGRVSATPARTSAFAIPGGLAAYDFVSYEDAAVAILDAVEGTQFDGKFFTALSPPAPAPGREL